MFVPITTTTTTQPQEDCPFWNPWCNDDFDLPTITTTTQPPCPVWNPFCNGIDWDFPTVTTTFPSLITIPTMTPTTLSYVSIPTFTVTTLTVYIPPCYDANDCGTASCFYDRYDNCVDKYYTCDNHQCTTHTVTSWTRDDLCTMMIVGSRCT
jgi:hypothetical protein